MNLFGNTMHASNHTCFRSMWPPGRILSWHVFNSWIHEVVPLLSPIATCSKCLFNFPLAKLQARAYDMCGFHCLLRDMFNLNSWYMRSVKLMCSTGGFIFHFSRDTTFRACVLDFVTTPSFAVARAVVVVLCGTWEWEIGFSHAVESFREFCDFFCDVFFDQVRVFVACQLVSRAHRNSDEELYIQNAHSVFFLPLLESIDYLKSFDCFLPYSRHVRDVLSLWHESSYRSV